MKVRVDQASCPRPTGLKVAKLENSPGEPYFRTPYLNSSILQLLSGYPHLVHLSC